MRHKVNLFTVTFTDGDGGVQTHEKNSVGIVWADVVPLSGAEQTNSLALDRPVTHRITVRDQDGQGFLNVKEITFGARVFRVEDALNPDFRERFIQYNVEEGGQEY